MVRKIKHCGTAVNKSTNKSDLPTYIKLGVGYGSGSASKWKVGSGSGSGSGPK
jgi:uncharacterized spore protein YtfJ